ncbi:MAG: sulfatase-like hydrolase/transferase, partial [bacterium]
THVDSFLDYSESVDGKAWQTPFYDELRARGLIEKEDNYYFFHKPELGMEGMPSQLSYRDSMEAWSVRETIRFIKESGGRPFCLQVAFQRPHQPFTPAQEFWDRYPDDLALPPTLNQSPTGRPPHFQHAWHAFHASTGVLEPRTFEAMARRLWHGYLGCVTQVDHAVGELLAFLDQSGLAQNTIVIYHADHGGYSGTHGIQEKAPGICSEAVCKVPFIWRVPGAATVGAVCNQLVESIDVAPTIAALCGLPPMATVDGHDLTPLCQGDDVPLREVAVTENPWSKALRWKHWRFVHYQSEMFDGQDMGELYDLAADPDETANLYHEPQHQETVNHCRRLLLEWLIRTTRVVTVWPPVACRDITDSHSYDFATVGDGKESNQAGPAQRKAIGQIRYL